MTNRSKSRGTAFESLIKDYLKEQWSDIVERMPLTGSSDCGDISNFRVGGGKHKVALELKNCSRLSLSEWIGEAQQEAKNYEAVAGAAIFKRKGKGAAGDQYVLLTLSDFLTVLDAAAS